MPATRSKSSKSLFELCFRLDRVGVVNGFGTSRLGWFIVCAPSLPYAHSLLNSNVQSPPSINNKLDPLPFPLLPSPGFLHHGRGRQGGPL